MRMGGQGVVLAAEAFEPDHFELPGREQGETATQLPPVATKLSRGCDGREFVCPGNRLSREIHVNDAWTPWRCSEGSGDGAGVVPQK